MLELITLIFILGIGDFVGIDGGGRVLRGLHEIVLQHFERLGARVARQLRDRDEPLVQIAVLVELLDVVLLKLLS